MGQVPYVYIMLYMCPVGVANTEENRRVYREMLFTAPQDITDSISAVILFHETLYQKCGDGVPFIEVFKKRNIIPGTIILY